MSTQALTAAGVPLNALSTPGVPTDTPSPSPSLTASPDAHSTNTIPVLDATPSGAKSPVAAKTATLVAVRVPTSVVPTSVVIVSAKFKPSPTPTRTLPHVIASATAASGLPGPTSTATPRRSGPPPSATPTRTPTSVVPVTTPIRIPTGQPVSTHTGVPVPPTHTFQLTRTPQEQPTGTPEVFNPTPRPSDTTLPIDTSTPTWTPTSTPTHTPVPTYTHSPTHSPTDTPTYTPTSTETPVPIPAECTLSLSGVSAGCASSTCVAWSGEVDNSGTLPVGASWEVQLQVKEGSGGFHTISTDSGSATFNPGGNSLQGTICGDMPADTTAFKLFVSVTDAANCNLRAASVSNDPCGPPPPTTEPQATNTPRPTNTVRPTNTPHPTRTLAPTRTPRPTHTAG